ncbi:MAG: ABC transporter permease [Chloroflexota bacterium]|nr:ABC transporter permease [Chloroflexota bacterium]
MAAAFGVTASLGTWTRRFRQPLLLGLTLVALGLVLGLLAQYNSSSFDDAIQAESTLGRLAIWMAAQSEKDPEEIRSPLAQYADHWADELGVEALDPAVLFNSISNMRGAYLGLIALILLIALAAQFARPLAAQKIYFAALLLLDVLLFLIPALEGSSELARLLLAILAVLAALALSPGKIGRVAGFFLALSLLMLGWEASKSFADAVNYKLLLPQASWSYERRPSLDEALLALAAGEIDVVVADRKDLDDLMPPHPPQEAGRGASADRPLPWVNLRYMKTLDRAQGFAFLPIAPAFPGRLSLAVRAEDAEELSAVRAIMERKIAAVEGDFADVKFLNLPRNLVLLDLKILNDLNLPHLQMIAEAFLQPARRNGEFLLLRILSDAGLYTFSEALLGFIFGAVLGFALGSLFAHSRLLERGLLPYVVASQTVPILAIAPMVVIWLGASQLSVAVIAAYLTFFPVTINTLRGLGSPDPAQIELMRSYAASRWTIMWKLRFPAALPYIFTALKVSATASVVGAIIGELPSGIGEGLGRAILDFSSDYSMISTPKLWASIVMAAAVGILFFVAVNLTERFVLRFRIRPLDLE